MRRIFLRTFIAAVCTLGTLSSRAQQRLDQRLFSADTDILPEGKGQIGLETDVLSFFKDNEFEGGHAYGYTLPGFWLRPRLTYQPLDNLCLEAGFHALVYDGAGKYPCYAFHDIATWKGDQYQRGAHVLPFLRVHARMGRWHLILGNIYGAVNHGISEPLFNPELNLTQDPEMGVQLMLKRPRYRFEAWCNWQSYIFEEDTHQEAFVFGVTQRVGLTAPGSRVEMYVPVDVLSQHRGGEQDATSLGVQTLVNGAVGLGLMWNAGSRSFDALDAEVLALGTWQQNGHLWPFDTGWAASASLSAAFTCGVRVFGSVLYGKDFVSLLGVPFYSTLSQKPAGGRFASVLVPHAGVEWCREFARDYKLGVKVDAYPVRAGGQFSNSFSFGVCFRCCPKFILRR